MKVRVVAPYCDINGIETRIYECAWWKVLDGDNSTTLDSAHVGNGTLIIHADSHTIAAYAPGKWFSAVTVSA